MKSQYLTAKEVTSELGISFGTLYSYVSRGLIRSEDTDGNTRHKRYWAEDVAALRNRREQRRNPTTSAASALDFGDPVLESSITHITSGKLFYRARPVEELARKYPLETVAGLLWTSQLQNTLMPLPPHTPALEQTLAALLPALPPMLTPVERFHALLPVAEAQDLAAHDKSPSGIIRTGARIYALLLTAISGRVPTPEQSIAQHLANWRNGLQPAAVDSYPFQEYPAPAPNSDQKDASSPDWVELLNAALILCADHELNVSSFTARCVASTGATPYGAVAAALAALQGPKHGSAAAHCEALIRDAQTNPRQALMTRLRRGERLPGFGHRLYPQGDPRAAYLLDRMRRQFLPDPGHTPANGARASVPTPESPASPWQTANRGDHPTSNASGVIRTVDVLIKEVEQTFNLRPTIDLALATLAVAAQLPPGASLTLFATGRLCGWIAHIIEQHQSDTLIRPRARYTGPDASPESSS